MKPFGKGLGPEDCRVIASILSERGSGRAWLFGSRAWGEPRPYSDVDIALEFRPDELGGLEDLRARFEESSLPFLVDLSVLEDLPTDWQERVLREGILIPSRDGGR